MVGKRARAQYRTNGRLTAASRIEYAARAERMLALRLAGLTEDQIGIQEETSGVAVHRIIRATIRRKTRNSPEADQLRTIEASRLDRLQAAIWKQAITPPVNLKAVGKILDIMDRRARLLGLDLQQDSGAGTEVRLTLEQLVIQSGLGQDQGRISGQAGRGHPSPGVPGALGMGGPTPSPRAISGPIPVGQLVKDADFEVTEKIAGSEDSASPIGQSEVEPFQEEG